MFQVVRSNNKGVMLRCGSSALSPGWLGSRRYVLYDVRTGLKRMYQNADSARRQWNRVYAQKQQYVAKGNHRYLHSWIV